MQTNKTHPMIEMLWPKWLKVWWQQHRQQAIQPEEASAFAVELAARNVQEGSGGPFGALLYSAQTGRLIGAGVNRVVAIGGSIWHAEMVALTSGQALCQHWDLSQSDAHPVTMVSSAQPCVMCFGAIWWSGIEQLTYVSPREDVESELGFAEGPLPPDWQRALRIRGISVSVAGNREKARQVLAEYRNQHGIIYNPKESPRL